MKNPKVLPKAANGVITAFETALDRAVVSVQDHHYRVDFGPGLRSLKHMVGKNRRCSCPLGDGCPAVQAVAVHLQNGGERAPDPSPGFWPVPPTQCPICGAETVKERRWNSPRRGAGWRCVQGGIRHYLDSYGQVLKQKLEDNPWVFPPVVVRNGIQITAYDGVEQRDLVLYPGLKREDLVIDK